jgi:formylglycine-generating enzyme required for sulfatase activity
MKKFILLLSCLWMATGAMANNVVISNISLITSGGPGNHTVQFDLTWDNSWRVSTGQNNYDGVWVFFKYRVGGGEWQHLTMTGTGNSINELMTIYQNTGATKTGAIIHRTSDYAGINTLGNIELGVSDIAGFGIDISGYAIEMVYIPQCDNCIIGDGNSSTESIQSLHVADNTSGALGSTFSVDVNSFDDATLEAGIAINAAGIAGNSAFATGQAFWSMKYELSQGAYRDFLNSLTLTQQTIRTANAPTSAIGMPVLSAFSSSRYSIEIATPSSGNAPAIYGLDASGNNVFNENTDGEWIACGLLSWQDLAAYLDWAGLSPMTEIGFERICRGASTTGVNPSILGEFAWGTASIFASTYTFNQLNSAFEVATNSSTTFGNAYYYGTDPNSVGPLRNGIFATGSSNRITSGASFYGVMEMSGNVSEPCVTVGNIAGRSFTGINGDGVLSVNGNANSLNWPCGSSTTSPSSCSEVTNSAGTTLRGGNLNFDYIALTVSVRIGFQAGNIRESTQGGRGVLYIQ